MKIALCGGGTLGHVIPALTVSRKISSLKPETEFIYIGSRKENEKALVEKSGIKFYSIDSGKLRRYFSLENFFDVFRIIKGFFEARSILRKERPDALFSKGGYESVPVVLAAHTLGIRSVTHESDMSLGLANKINAKFCDKVCLGFPLSIADGRKYVHTGNPVRDDLLSCDLPEDKEPLLLVLGGSLGAVEVNNAVYENLDELLSFCSVVHQAGPHGDFSIKRDRYRQVEFISDELPSLIRRSWCVLSRAGANAVSEFLAAEKPMVLMPLKTNASRGDQILNAEFLERKGEAIIADRDSLVKILRELFMDEEKRENIKKRIRDDKTGDAALRIAQVVIGG